MGKMGSIWRLSRALSTSIWGHCSRTLVSASIWGTQNSGHLQPSLFETIVLSRGILLGVISELSPPLPIRSPPFPQGKPCPLSAAVRARSVMQCLGSPPGRQTPDDSSEQTVPTKVAGRANQKGLFLTGMVNISEGPLRLLLQGLRLRLTKTTKMTNLTCVPQT